MRTTARLVALGLILTACSVSNAESLDTSTTTTEPATSTTDPSTTTTTSVTTTTVDGRPTSLINGLPVDDPATQDRRVLAVKIDNHPKANPQSGIDQADMIIELRVEGITRYISIWHESDSEYLGPMRSGRPTDPTLLAAMNEPTFAISGAQAWVQSVIVSKDVHLVGEVGPPATFRVSDRSAPHNLYVNTMALRDRADGRGYPDEPPSGPLWEFGPMSELSDPATHIDIDFGNTVSWDWDDELNVWHRTGYGELSTVVTETAAEEESEEETAETPIGVPVLVALYVEQYTASPPAGVSGKSLPSSRTTGSGKAYVFADGRVTEGTWEREVETEWFKLTDANGETLLVPPGKVWVSLVPDHLGLTFES